MFALSIPHTKQNVSVISFSSSKFLEKHRIFIPLQRLLLLPAFSLCPRKSGCSMLSSRWKGRAFAPVCIAWRENHTGYENLMLQCGIPHFPLGGA